MCIRITVLYLSQTGVFIVTACASELQFCISHRLACSLFFVYYNYSSVSVSQTGLFIVNVYYNYSSVSVSQTGLFIVTACASELQFCISHRLACSLLLHVHQNYSSVSLTDWPVHCFLCIIITLLYLFHRLACSLLMCIIITLLYLFHRLACSLLLHVHQNYSSVSLTDWPVHCYCMCIRITVLYLSQTGLFIVFCVL